MTNKPTREQILSLPPGRELNILIAKFVLRKKIVWLDRDYVRVQNDDGILEFLPSSSTCWKAFEDVMQAFNDKNVMYQLKKYVDQVGTPFYYTTIDYFGKILSIETQSTHSIMHAGCQAALLAVLEI